VILFFGFLSWYKGLDILLESFREIRAVLPAARLFIAGDPNKLRPGELEEYRAIPSRHGFSDSVDWRVGYVPMEDVPRCFLAADCVALPYREVSQSGVLHLAYAFARPVVATRVGGFPETVADGITGLLVPPADAAALAAALLRLLSDDRVCRRMGAAARQQAEAAHDWGRVAEETRTLYQTLARGGSAGAERSPSAERGARA
jgi:glycosyltransferase involved in cell wall biosynthesis